MKIPPPPTTNILAPSPAPALRAATVTERLPNYPQPHLHPSLPPAPSTLALRAATVTERLSNYPQPHLHPSLPPAPSARALRAATVTERLSNYPQPHLHPRLSPAPSTPALRAATVTERLSNPLPPTLPNEPSPKTAHPLTTLLFLALCATSLIAQPRIGDCPILPPGNIWNVAIDKLPVAANSAAYIRNNGPTRALHADMDNSASGIPYVIVPQDQPLVPIAFTYADESDPGPYPIPADAPIEGAGVGDAHVLVVQNGTCKLYEVYAAARQPDGSWKGGSGAIFDLRSNALRPDTWTSTDAAGLPVLPGLLRYDEVASGAINHALRLTVPSTGKAHVWPARHDASRLTDPGYPPMGQRFRLKANFDISGFPTDAQVVLLALKKYGLILADNGSSWYITGAPDPRWNMDTISTIRKVTGNDLEAVDSSSLMVSADSGLAKGASLRTIVLYSPTPLFDFTFNPTASITLTGDVSAPTVTGFTDGATYTFLICQDNTGGRTFSWPSNTRGGMTINPSPSACSAQTFVSDGTTLYATSPGSTN